MRKYDYIQLYTGEKDESLLLSLRYNIQSFCDVRIKEFKGKIYGRLRVCVYVCCVHAILIFIHKAFVFFTDYECIK
jgi:hypothetical protein